MSLVKVIVPESEIQKIVEVLDQNLKSPFVIWMKGEMGSGKTTLVRHFLRSKGLSEDTPVVSPTYTIMNEYQIGKQWYAHLDLYRAEDTFSLDEIGVKDTREYSGIFVEWPETPPEDETLKPTHIIQIAYAEDGNARSYDLSEA